MKKMTIKMRITLYFTLIMTVFAVSMLFYSYYISKSSAKLELRDNLEGEVFALGDTLVFEEIKQEPPLQKPDETAPPEFTEETSRPAGSANLGYGPGEDKIPPTEGDKSPDSKRFDYELTIPESSVFSVNGIDMCVSYSKNGEAPVVYGALAQGISLPATLTDGAFTEIEGENDKYYLFTCFIPASDRTNQGAWVAGTVSTSSVVSIATNSLKWILLAVPFIIIIAAILGYLVTKRAFRPVSEITAAAASLSKGDTLDKRINFKGAKDEIGVLADTFDGMLDTIESNFTKEKQFTDNASHELRTPVAVILAQSELGLDPEATHEDRQQALESIHRQAKKMNKLLHVLLSVARADNGRLRLELEKFDLAEMARTVAQEQNIIAADKNIAIIADAEECVTVNADRMQIISVMVNLVINAIKYGKDGGRVVISVKAIEGNAVCTVTDDGVGISEEHLPRVWERFFRVSEARTADTTDSMGMGLAIVKSIINAHGGTVDATSVLGEGSSFSFVLKLI